MPVTETADIARAWSRARRNASIQFGLWSVILCMATGLIMKMRPSVILGRAAVAFLLSAALGYILILVIQMHSRSRKQKPSDHEEDVEESQDEQEYIESGA